MRHVVSAALVVLLWMTPVFGAHADKFDQDKGRTLENVDMIRRFHPIEKEPEVDIAAESERISNGEKVSGHFGEIVGMPNGDIVAAHVEAATKKHGGDDPTRRVLVRTSQDGGYTWTLGVDAFADVRDKMQGHYATHAILALVALADGTILLGPVKLNDGKFHVPRSKDGGKTWDFDVIIPRWVRDFTQMDNGEVVGLGDYSTDLGVKSRAVLIAGPEMKEWEIVSLGPESGYETDEGCLATTGKPGEVYLLMRDQHRSHYYTNARSADYGRTWQGYSPSGLWFSLRPSKPFVIDAKNGMLLAAHSERSNGRIVITPSFDGGHTWDLSRRIFLVDAPGAGNALGGSHGYCSMAPSGKDAWFAAWYDPRSYRGSTADTRYITRPYEGARLAAPSGVDNAQLLARWPFEGGKRDVVEGWPHCDYGRATMIGRRAGKIGKAAFFNGKTSGIQIPDSPTMRVPKFFTVECFFRADRLEGEQALVSKRPYYYLGLSGDKVTFQIGPAPERKSDRKTFRVDSPEPVKAKQWYHVGGVVTTSGRNYKTMRLYLNGKDVANDNLNWAGMGKDMSFADAAFYRDERPESGPLFMDYGEYDGYQVKPKCHLTLGVDNETGGARFKGEIDEVGLYARGLLPVEVDRLSKRQYAEKGVVTSDPIALEGPFWGTFQADASAPQGTAIRYDVLDADGKKILVENVKPGQSIRDLKAPALRLRATLSTTKPGVTPILRGWAITGSGDD